MREIKFRGRKLVGEDAGKWAYGWLSTNIKGNPVIKDDNAQFPVAVDAETVGQYTGMKDCDGTEIYEGDIVSTDDEDIAVITWDEDEYKFTVDTEEYFYDLGEYYPKDLEVIGNIHKNPDLLGGDAK